MTDRSLYRMLHEHYAYGLRKTCAVKECCKICYISLPYISSIPTVCFAFVGAVVVVVVVVWKGKQLLCLQKLSNAKFEIPKNHYDSIAYKTGPTNIYFITLKFTHSNKLTFRKYKPCLNTSHSIF